MAAPRMVDAECVIGKDGGARLLRKFAGLDVSTADGAPSEVAVVAAVANRKIRVLRAVMYGSGVTNCFICFKSGTAGTALTGTIPLNKTAGTKHDLTSPWGLFETVAGVGLYALVTGTSAEASSVDGFIEYVEI